MSRFNISLLILILAATSASAQDTTEVSNTKEKWEVGFDAEIGLLELEDVDGEKERFFSTVLMPTFSNGQWALGFRVKARLNGNGFREEDYDSFADILSIARFVQYSDKPSTHSTDRELYARGGELENVTIGYGQIISEYRNTVSVDNPLIGIEGRRGVRELVVEGVYSSVTEPGIWGLRGALWPFRARTDSRLTEALVGATIAGDLSADGQLVNRTAPGVPYVREGDPDNPLIGVVQGSDDGVLVMASVDVGMPLLRVDSDNMLLIYSEVAKILGFGEGISLGLNGRKRRGDVQFQGWFEQRRSGKEYLPNYFNSLYEIERVQRVAVDLGDGTSIPAFTSKRNVLAGQDESVLGSFVAFEAAKRRKYRMRTSYEKIWNHSNLDWFHIDIRVYDPELPYQLRFMFDRINMDSPEDIFTGRAEDGIFRVEIAYQVHKHLLLGFRFRQSFEPFQELGRIVGQDKKNRLEPNFVIRL